MHNQKKSPRIDPDEERALDVRLKKARAARLQLSMRHFGNGYDTTEEELSASIKDGKQAIERLIRGNFRLNLDIARTYLGQGLPFLDLLQQGSIGLQRATNKWDAEKGKFSTYATPWVHAEIKKEIQQRADPIRIPTHSRSVMMKLYTTKKRLEAEGKDVSPRALALELNWLTTKGQPNVTKVARLLGASHRFITMELDAPVGHHSSKTFGEQLSADISPAEHQASFDALRAHIQHYLARLPRDDAEVLSLRYGLNEGTPHTQPEVAVRMNISVPTVQSRERRALARLREMDERNENPLKDDL